MAYREHKWNHVSTKRIPVDVVARPQNNKIMVEMPKPFPADFRPFTSLEVKTIKAKINQYDPCHVQKHEMNAHGEVTQKQLEFRSEKFAHSKFTVDVPFNFLSRGTSKLYFTLKIEQGRVLMQTIDGQFIADQTILDKNGVSLTFQQLMKFQQIMTDTRKRFKPTEQDIYKMFDEDGHFREDDDQQ